jgi:hypothetical protein
LSRPIVAHSRRESHHSDGIIKTLVADQAGTDAGAHNTLEYAAENAAVAEPLIAGPRILSSIESPQNQR